MKRDSRGRFVAEVKPDCGFEDGCTDKGEKCATCQNRLKKSYYVPEVTHYVFNWTVPEIRTIPGSWTVIK